MEDSNSPSPERAPDPVEASRQQPKNQPLHEPHEPFAPPSPSQAPLPPPEDTWTRTASPSWTAPIRPAVRQPQPIRDAVDKAFDQSQPANTLDPAFIAQVTEAVVKNLQNNPSLNPRTPVAPQAAQYPPPPTVHSVPPSPALSSTASLPPRFTPPDSPQRGRERPNTAESRTSVSPISAFSDGEGTFGKGGTHGDASKLGDRDGDTPKPVFGSSSVGSKLSESIREELDAEDLSRVEEGCVPSDRRGSRDSVGSLPGVTRPRAYPPNPHGEVTTLERIWQPLFDNGIPTARLGQFLRGIAIHIIEDYEPKGSLVITPSKMLRFLDETKVDDELYPWHLVFGGGMNSASISVMFRRLKCQHHLVQTQLHEVPNVPGLTPAGFETFLACLIQAHPDSEFDRLSKAVMNMPISNADYKSERFPKELSRRLLPLRSSPIAEQCLIASMAHEANLLQLRNSNAMPPPPTSAPPQQSTFQERERKPYSQSSVNEANEDDESDFVPSVSIERERKPYSGKEGTGKVFVSDNLREDSVNAGQPRPIDPTVHMPAPRPSYYDHNTSGATPYDPRVLPPTRKHRSSTGPGMPPTGQAPSAGYSKGRRSPPPMSAYIKSDPVNVGDIPAAQYASNLHSPRPFDREQPDDNPQYYPSRRGHTPTHNGFEDETPYGTGRARTIPPRTSQGPPLPGPPAYDSSYGTASTASFPGPRSRHYEERRRSMYGGPPGVNAGGSSGGSDGWGSYANGNGVYPPPQGHGNAGMQH
jgi:hypothetical protein